MSTNSDISDLHGISHDLLEELAHRATRRQISEGAQVFTRGGCLDALLTVLSGTLRIEKTSAGGRQGLHYRVRGGERRNLTAACLLTDGDETAKGFAETDLDILWLPRATVDDLMASSAEFRGLIFRAYSRQIVDLLTAGGEAARHQIDLRLSGRLLDLAGQGNRVVVTHRQIANELGTACNAVSRHLQTFQRRGWVNIGPGVVTVQDKHALRAFVTSRRRGLSAEVTGQRPRAVPNAKNLSMKGD